MKNIIQMLLICGLFFNSYLSVAQSCTASLVPPVTLPNGISVTSSFTGSVGTYPAEYTSCANIKTPENSIWLGQDGPFTYTLVFDAPVNNIQVNITGSGQGLDEYFIFTTNAGDPVITTSHSCFSVITGNTIASGLDSYLDGGGGEFIISTPTNFTQLTISGEGGVNGSLFSICQNAVTCPLDLTLGSSIDDMSNISPIGVRHRQVQNSIKATNLILVGDNSFQNGVVYHAGNFIELNPGFEAVLGAQFSAYIEDCSGNYVYRPGNTNVTKQDKDPANNKEILSIFPNPVIDKADILIRNTTLQKVIVYSVDGKILYHKKSESSNRLHLDMSGYTKGIYIITITSVDGRSYTRKLVKN